LPGETPPAFKKFSQLFAPSFFPSFFIFFCKKEKKFKKSLKILSYSNQKNTDLLFPSLLIQTSQNIVYSMTTAMENPNANVPTTTPSPATANPTQEQFNQAAPQQAPQSNPAASGSLYVGELDPTVTEGTPGFPSSFNPSLVSIICCCFVRSFV
jgi:hypothetical protein